MWHWLRSVPGVFGGGPSAGHAARLARYKQLRQVGLELNNRLVETLSRNALDEGGKNLGILRKNVLVLDTEDEIAVLVDYCLHDLRRQGRNAIERYLAESPPAEESNEMVLLQALCQARFSVFAMEACERGVGAHVRDLLLDEPLFLTDVGLSRTASRGLVLAARVIAPDGIGMTTGAALPLGVLSPADRAGFLEDLKKTLRRADFRTLSKAEASKVATALIRTCLRMGAAEDIQYVEPGSRSAPGLGSRAPPPTRVRGNGPCPCGSGRKFKQCCGRRQ